MVHSAAVKNRVARALLGAALLLLVPLATAEHLGHVERVAGTAVSQHDHGPHAPCPPATPTHCLACAAAGLFGAPPDAAVLPVPQLSSEHAAAVAFAMEAGSPSRPNGRSPPVA